MTLTTGRKPALTVEQRAAFYRDGYIVLPGFLSPEEMREFQGETDEFHRTLSDPAKVPAGVDIGWEDRKDGGEPRIQQLLFADKVSPFLHRLIRSEKLMSMMRELVGPELKLFESKFVLKSAHVGGEVPWHQDFAYWKSFSRSPVQVNAMIYIDDADATNGALEVIPGSHLTGVRDHGRHGGGRTFTLATAPSRRGDEHVVLIPGKAGTAILFGPLILHHSAPNRSDRQRRSVTIVYTIPGWDERKTDILAERTVVPPFTSYFPAEQVGRITGHGPHGGQSAENYRRRELWKLAASKVADRSDSWVEVSTCESDEDSFEFITGRKPAQAKALRFERVPLIKTERDDVVVRTGLFEDTVPRTHAEIGQRIGFLHVDTDTYLNTRSALNDLVEHITIGTVIVLDKFHGFPGAEREAALAFHEFAERLGWGIEYIGRADHQVALRIAPSGVSTPEVTWIPTVEDIEFGLGQREPAQLRDESPTPPSWRRALARVKRLRLLIRRLRVARYERSAMGRFFPVSDIPQFFGDGPLHTYSPTHARRRELWKYAQSLVADRSLPWAEFGVGEGESFDWFVLSKPRTAQLFGFDSFEGLPEAWSGHGIGHWRSAAYVPNLPDVHIITGAFAESFARPASGAAIGPKIGLVHLDVDLYSSTKAILAFLGGRIGPDTVLIFDEFYAYSGWKDHEAKAWREFVGERGISFEYIARSDGQVAVRVLSVGGKSAHRVRPLDWTPQSPGLFVATNTAATERLLSW